MRQANGEMVRFQNFSDITLFNSVGMSIIYTAKSNVEGKNGIDAGDLVYFKANNARGVNTGLVRTDESLGSCEDYAEVLGHYVLKGLSDKLGSSFILRTTPYDFAEYHNDSFWKIVSKQTGGTISSDRLYGCISKNCIADNATIIHGNAVLATVANNSDIHRSSTNNIYNYSKGLECFKSLAAKNGQDLVIDPVCERYLANTLFFDFFYCNSDRHNRNINFQQIPLSDGRFLIEPLAVIDNGGGLGMQSPNCSMFYQDQLGLLKTFGSLSKTNRGYSSLSPQMDLYAGDKTFFDQTQISQDGQIMSGSNQNMTHIQQIVQLALNNRVLYQDLKNMYQNIDFMSAFRTMNSETGVNENFIPGFKEVLPAVLDLKKYEISQEMARTLGEEFNEQAFQEDPNYYIDKFESIVKDDSLSIHIATDQEIQEFNATFRPEAHVDNTAVATTSQNPSEQ